MLTAATTGDTQLDVTTLLVGLAVIVFSVSLAQLVLLIVSAVLRNRSRRGKNDRDGDGIHDDDDLLI